LFDYPEMECLYKVNDTGSLDNEDYNCWLNRCLHEMALYTQYHRSLILGKDLSFDKKLPCFLLNGKSIKKLRLM